MLMFMNCMDVDRDGSVSKAEFLTQYAKLQKMTLRNKEAYLREVVTMNDINKS